MYILYLEFNNLAKVYLKNGYSMYPSNEILKLIVQINGQYFFGKSQHDSVGVSLPNVHHEVIFVLTIK